MNWREIRAESVAWESNPISKRAGGYVEMMCNKTYWYDGRHQTCCGAWHDKTLGYIADLGPRHWLHCHNIGPMGVDVIMWVIDESASGRCPYIPTKGKAPDAYQPKVRTE